MSELWPHLPFVVSALMYQELPDRLAEGTLSPQVSHPEQTWAPIGGRIRGSRIRELIDAVTELAEKYGFPAPASPDARITFDRDVAQVLREHLDLTWSEAGNKDLWSFLALVVLPHVTMWRFGLNNRERWIASDPTRHTWSRLWWQAQVFAGHEQVLSALTESDLNQLMERRRIGGDPRLTCGLGRVITELPPDVPRRPVIRDVAARMRRYLAFLDVRALSEQQIYAFCSALTNESVSRLPNHLSES